MGSGLIGLHMKGAPTGELLTISRNWLVLGGTVPPGSARPQDVQAPKYKKNKKHSNIIHACRVVPPAIMKGRGRATGVFVSCMLGVP